MTAFRSVRVQLIVLVLATIPAAGSAQGLFDRQATFSFGGISFPAAVDTFTVMGTNRYPQPSLGVHLQYRTPLDPSASLDIYVYPTREAGLEAELGVAVQDIIRYTEENRQGVTATVDTTHAITLTDAAGRTHDGWVAIARFERRGDIRPTVLYLFEKDGRYFKYRVTHAAPLRQRLESHLDAFLAGTLAGITTMDP